MQNLWEAEGEKDKNEEKGNVGMETNLSSTNPVLPLTLPKNNEGFWQPGDQPQGGGGGNGECYEGKRWRSEKADTDSSVLNGYDDKYQKVDNNNNKEEEDNSLSSCQKNTENPDGG